MNVHFVMRALLVSLRIVPVLLIVTAHLSCQARQEDVPKPSPPAATVLPSESGILELPEGSPTFAHFQTERVALHPIRATLKAQAGKILANENRLAHLSARVPGRIVAVYADLGDRVKEGGRLLLLDSPAFGEAQLEYRKARNVLGVTEKIPRTGSSAVGSRRNRRG